MKQDRCRKNGKVKVKQEGRSWVVDINLFLMTYLFQSLQVDLTFEVALACRASAIIYKKTWVYGDYQLIIAMHEREYSAVDFAADCHLYFICKYLRSPKTRKGKYIWQGFQLLPFYTMHLIASYYQPPVIDHKFYDLFMFYTGMMNSLTQKEVWVPNIPEWRIFFLCKNSSFSFPANKVGHYINILPPTDIILTSWSI